MTDPTPVPGAPSGEMRADLHDNGSWPEIEYDGTTHYPGCWQAHGHHNCAVEWVRRLAGLSVEDATIKGEAP